MNSFVGHIQTRDVDNRTLNLFCVRNALITSESTGIVSIMKQMRRSVIDFLSNTARSSDCEQRVMVNGFLTYKR